MSSQQREKVLGSKSSSGAPEPPLSPRAPTASIQAQQVYKRIDIDLRDGQLSHRHQYYS